MKYTVAAVLIITFLFFNNAEGKVIEMISPQNDVRITVVAEEATIIDDRKIFFQNITSIRGKISDRPERNIEIKKEHERITVPSGYKIILSN